MPHLQENQKPTEILLAENAPGEVRLVSEALNQFPTENHLHVAKDGKEALDFLWRRNGRENVPKPDLVLLDLNLPRVSGLEVLQKVKHDPHLRHIPVVVLTGSKNEEDISKAYAAHANCYVTKPEDLNDYFRAMESVFEFWLKFTRLHSSKNLKTLPKHGTTPNHDYLELLSQNLRQEMNRTGDTLDSLEAGTGIPKSTIWRILNRKSRNPKLETIVRIAKHLKIDLKELFNAPQQTS